MKSTVALALPISNVGLDAGVFFFFCNTDVKIFSLIIGNFLLQKYKRLYCKVLCLMAHVFVHREREEKEIKERMNSGTMDVVTGKEGHKLK